MSATEASEVPEGSNGPEGRLRTRRPTQLPAGRHGLPREFVVENQKARIIDAMSHVVARKGYGETSVADVLKEAGVSRRTFYEHYRSKEDCFLATFDAVSGALIERVEASYAATEGSWEERVVAALKTFLDILHREPEFSRTCLVEALSAGQVARDRYGVAVERFEGVFARAASDSAEVEGLPGGLARAIVGGISSVIYRSLAEGNEEQMPGLLPSLTYFCLAPYVGRDAALEHARAAVDWHPANDARE